MNITEQKQRELKEEQQKRLFFESQNIIKGLSAFYHSVFYVDLAEETFQIYNAREDLTDHLRGSNRYETLKRTYSDYLIYRDDQERFARELELSEVASRLSAGDTIFSLEYRRDYGGYYGLMRMHIILAESRNGLPAKVILAAHNVEEEKEKQEQNERALFAAYEAAKNANEAKSKFLAQMSHDIRTPINAIIGLAAITSTAAGDAEQVRNYMEKIKVSGNHLLHLINEVLDMSKVEKGTLALLEEPFQMTRLMEGLQTMLQPEAEEKNQILTFQTDLIHDHLMRDEGRLRQVLINLINNALKYTPEGGRIAVAVLESPPREPGYGSFVFSVEDNGIGMLEEHLDYIFVPFYRADDPDVRHVQGTGLGMPIAQGIVSAMQGDIQVESEMGKGSRFLVDGAENGYEAVQAFAESAPGTYQAILMDLQMPVMDGYAATKEIRVSGHPQAKKIPLIALTANAFAEDITKALAAGMNDHVSKPIDYQRLLQVMHRYMEAASGA